MTAAEPLPKLQAYTRHLVSYQLEANHPYLDDIRSHLGADEVSTAFGSRTFPRLHELATDPKVDPPVLVETLETITSLISNQEHKVQAIEAGICQAASDLMLHKDVHVQRAAVTTLSRLALVLQGRQALKECEAADRLSDLLLSSEDEEVQARVADAMACFSTGTDGCQYLVDRGSVHAMGSHLLGALPKPSSATIAACAVGLLSTLRHVTVNANLGVRDLVGQGVLRKIVEFIATNQTSGIPTVADPAAAELDALALLGAVCMDATGRKELLDAQAVEVLCESTLMSEKPVAVHEKALSALVGLSIEVDGKKRLVPCVKVLCDFLIKPPSDQAKDAAWRLCLSAGELPAFRLELSGALVKLDCSETLRAIYGVSVCCEYALLLEKSKSMRFRKQVIEALCTALTTTAKEAYKDPMDANNRDATAYTLFTCPAIVDRLLTLALKRPGATAEDTEAPTRCLATLCSNAEGAAELVRVATAKPCPENQLTPELKKVFTSVGAPIQ
jgi:CxxC motif-containing protein